MLYCSHRNKQVLLFLYFMNKLIHYFSEVISPPHKLRFITSVMKRSNTLCEKREQTPATVSFFYTAAPPNTPQPPEGRFLRRGSAVTPCFRRTPAQKNRSGEAGAAVCWAGRRLHKKHYDTVAGPSAEQTVMSKPRSRSAHP